MKMPFLNYNDRVEIIWNDTMSNSDWSDIQELAMVKTEGCIYTIGYFWLIKDGRLFVSHSRSPKGDNKRDYTGIPLGCIRKVKMLYFASA